MTVTKNRQDVFSTTSVRCRCSSSDSNDSGDTRSKEESWPPETPDAATTLNVTVSAQGSDKSNSTKRTQSVVRNLSLHRVLYSFIHPATGCCIHWSCTGCCILWSCTGVSYSIRWSCTRVLHSLILHRVLYSLILHRVLCSIHWTCTECHIVFADPAQGAVFSDSAQGVVFSDPAQGVYIVFADPAQGVI